MENNKITYIKADDNTIINEKQIRWIKKMSDCLEVCSKQNGCRVGTSGTHKICKQYNNETYEKVVNEHFNN